MMAILKVEGGLLKGVSYYDPFAVCRAFVKFWKGKFPATKNRSTDRRDAPPLAAAILQHQTLLCASRGYLQSISRACSRS